MVREAGLRADTKRGFMKRSFRALAAGISLATVSLAVPVISQAGAVASGSRHTMIVLLRSSNGSLHALSRSEARSVVSNSISASGGKIISSLSAPSAVVVRVTNAEAARLAKNPAVLEVVVNGTFQGPKNTTVKLTAHISGKVSSAHVASLCGTAGAPEQDPQALSNISAPGAWSAGATGVGVQVAYMAEGIDTTIADFQRNAAYASAGSAAGTPVITNYKDFTGDGTNVATGGGEAFLDASSIAAQGNSIYDLSNYGVPGLTLPAGCDITVTGSAPGASVTALKVFGVNNLSTNVGFISAVDYAVSSGVKVLNESFGSNPLPDTSVDVIKNANDAAVAAGVTVVVSSGDAGVTNTIGSPASDPNVIAVGASTTFRAYAQGALGGTTFPGWNGDFLDNNISALSSGGVTSSGRTVDLVAPGDLNWTLCSTDPNYTDCGSALSISGGTSESAPLTAGAAADVIQAYRSTHSGAYPSPALIKSILMSSATDITATADQQGAGLLNITGAVALAKTINKTVSGAGGGVLSTTNALNLTNLPGKSTKANLSFTNDTSSKKTVTLKGIRFVSSTAQSGVVTLDPSTSSTQPTLTYWSGAQEVYQTSHFTVVPGQAKLQVSSTYNYTAQTSLLHMAVFAPDGTFAGYSEPQGLAGYATTEIANPVAGLWTALFFTVSNNNSPSSVGTSGPVQWEADTYVTQSFKLTGALPLVLKPGKSGTERIKVKFPSLPGDSVYAIAATSAAGTILIPVTLRTSIPIIGGQGSFVSSMTGGNGRAQSPAQANTYNFAVPSGQSNLEVDIELANYEPLGFLPGTQVIGIVTDPNGQIVSYDTNYTVDGLGNGAALPYLSLYAANPVAGEYQLTLSFQNPVVASAISSPIHGQILFNAVQITSNLPNSSSASVSKSAGATGSVTVTNNGFTPIYVGTDARTNTYESITLPDINGNPSTQPFNSFFSYFVPPQTKSVTATLNATIPSSFDFGSAFGGPDISPLVPIDHLTASSTATSATATYAPPGGIGSSEWYVLPGPTGPFTTTPVDPTGMATVDFSVLAKGFDSAVTSDTGDLVTDIMGLGINNGPGVTILPGQTVTIGIYFNPTGTVGSVSSGTLSVGSFSIGFLAPELVGTPPAISNMAVIPYKYKIVS
jgi:hypothetical protein